MLALSVRDVAGIMTDRVTHLAWFDDHHTIARCGATAGPSDLVLQADLVTCPACREAEAADALALARELGEAPPSGTVDERLTAVEHRLTELVRELAAVRQLVQQLREGTTDILEYFDRNVQWKESR